MSKPNAALILVTLGLVVAIASACSGQPGPAPAPTTAASRPAATSVPKPAQPAAPTPTSSARSLAAPTAAASGEKVLVPTPPADGSRPLAQLSPAQRANHFTGPAALWIKANTSYVVTIVTSKGNIVAELYQDTPESVNNFVTLALNGFYDGLTFHRVEPNFVIQGGDPLGTGGGGPGYTIPAEIKHKHTTGALAWARTGDQVNPQRRSSGSQFYITLAEQPGLDGQYTVFGQVTQGMDVAGKIAVGDKITRIDVTQAQAATLPTALPGSAPTAVAPTVVPTPYAPTSQSGRPLAQLPVAKRQGVYNKPPAMTINPAKTYQATISTAKGNIVIDLDAKNAPASVNNFVMLANLGFYDSMPVAFADATSWAILGSPGQSPESDVGYALELEPAANATKPVTGTVAYYPSFDPVTDQPKASGSQFFIAFVEVPQTDTPFNVFGKISSGLDIAKQLQADDVVKTITITEK